MGKPGSRRATSSRMSKRSWGLVPGLNLYAPWLVPMAMALGGDVDLVLHAGQGAQLRLHHHAVVVGVLHHLAGQGDILLKGLAAGVDHHGGEAPVHTAFAQLIAVAVVQMQGDGQAGLGLGGLHQLHEIGVVGVGPGALGDLQDHGGLDLRGGLGDALDDLHVVDVERTDGVAAVIGFFEHLGGSDNRHIMYLHYSIGCSL